VLDPQVLGPADAGTAEMTANAKARARVILVNIVILLVWKQKWFVLVDVMVQRAANNSAMCEWTVHVH
jgi:hypothetical protein